MLLQKKVLKYVLQRQPVGGWFCSLCIPDAGSCAQRSDSSPGIVMIIGASSVSCDLVAQHNPRLLSPLSFL